MNPSALQILKAFAEAVAKGKCQAPAHCIPSRCCIYCNARVALEASAKAPGLADDSNALKLFAVDTKLKNQDDICRAILRNIDDYQRGGKL